VSARGRRISQRGYIQQARRNASRQRQILRRVHAPIIAAMFAASKGMLALGAAFDRAAQSVCDWSSTIGDLRHDDQIDALQYAMAVRR
jgi:hypothetical protein